MNVKTRVMSALPGQRREVEHQPHVLGVRLGDADGPGELGQLGVALLRELDAPLDGAHRIEVLRDPRAVAGPDLALEAREVRADGVEDAPVLAELRARRSAVEPPSPKRRSKTTRGLFSIGSGVVGSRHAMVFM